MMKNYIRITLRNFKRHKGYTFINFAGLAIGLAVTLIITLYVMDDLKYDKFHRDADRIYRILSVGVKRGTKNSITAGPLVPAFKEGIPEVEYATRVVYGEDYRSGLGEDFGTPMKDPSLHRMSARRCGLLRCLRLQDPEGDSGEALGKPGAVFSRPKRPKPFSAAGILGQPIAVRALETSFVAGIVAAPPTTSHIRFGIIVALIPEQIPSGGITSKISP